MLAVAQQTGDRTGACGGKHECDGEDSRQESDEAAKEIDGEKEAQR